jgi:Porin subfamily
MRRTFLVIFAAVVPAFGALAEQSVSHKPDKPTTAGKLLPLKGATSSNSCAAYGAGFAKVEGTDTCVKIGGAVSIGVGGSRVGH